MLTSNLAITGTIIEVLPVLETETASNGIKSFFDTIEKTNTLPLNKPFYYSDNLWDFSPYKTVNVENHSLKFNFDVCDNTYKKYVKNYILFKLIATNTKIQSLCANFYHINSFLRASVDKHYYDIQDISDSFLDEYITNIQNTTSYSNFQLAQCAIKDFLNFYSLVYKNVLSKKKKAILETTNPTLYRAQKEAGKYKTIPKTYYDKLLPALIKVIDNDESEPEMKALAAFVLILSQTGLRISECLDLEIDSIKSITLSNGESAYYLRYKTWKREKKNNVYSFETTYVNSLTKKGYDILESIYRDKRSKYNTKHLFLGTDNHKQFPLSASQFRSIQTKLYVHLNNYFPTVNLPEGTYEGITNKPLRKQDEFVAMPDTHQYRVHVCTELYNKGVPLQYIEKFMAHLSNEMAGYYVRPNKQNPQENMDFTLETLKKIVTGETKLLGGNQGLIDKINEFIEKNEYNVETDLQTICEKLAEQIPIRQKTGGVCIKSSMLRECSKDAKTNEFYCAYGVCQNIFHFYYMANISYRQVCELAETIAINKQRGLFRQVQKEEHMLKHIAKTKLIPELDELKNVLDKKGYEAIVMEYPDLKDIIENLDEIYKEALSWSKIK